MTDKVYRVAAIGCGRKGTEHARAYNLNSRSVVVAGADPDPENLDIFTKRFGVPGYADYNEMLRKENVDIVLAVLPVIANREVVMASVRHDVPAICTEKPLAARLADADEMVAACRERGIKFGCGDLERNHHYYWEAKDKIAAGEVGAVQSINFYQGSGTQLSGGGCQIFGLTRLFAGDADVDWMTGWVATDPWSEYDQGGAGYIRFVNGFEAFLHRSITGRHGFEVLCDRGRFTSNNMTVRMYTHDPDEARPTLVNATEVISPFSDDDGVHGGFGLIDDEGWENTGNRQRATVQSMIDALDHDMEPRGNGDNGRKVLEMAIAIRESHRRGHAPVNLPLEDRSLRLFPHPSRMYNKKEVLGREAYAKEIARFTRGQNRSV